MSHRCHRLRAQNVSLQAHAIVFTVSPRGNFPPLPLFDHRRVGILSWHIVCCCNKSELKLIITLSSYHIICCSNPIVAIAVYRPLSPNGIIRIDDGISSTPHRRWIGRLLTTMYRSSDVTDPSHISPMVWGRDHTAAIGQQRANSRWFASG